MLIFDIFLGGDVSPNSIRRVSGETRLDRLVRRPSGEKGAPPLPPPNKPSNMRKPSVKPRSTFSVQSPVSSDHLYDIVAKDEDEKIIQGNNLSKQD